MQVSEDGLGVVKRHKRLPRIMILLTLFLSLALPQAAASAPGTWAYTADTLDTARRNHTATLLPDGKVLVVGGTNSSPDTIYYRSAERFDPADGSWVTVASLPVDLGRSYHSATLLETGQVLVAGGVGGNNQFPSYLTSAQLYDPINNTWTATGDLKAVMVGHTATLLENGQVLVFGGITYKDPQLYNPEGAGTWSYAKSTGGRQYHTATRLKDGRVLVVGGEYTKNTAEIYDPKEDTWTPAASLHHGRYYHTATLLPNGKVLVAAGLGSSGYEKSAEIYDPQSNTWTDTGSLNENREQHQAVMLDNGQVLVVGGAGTAIGMTSAELYTPASGKWSSTGPLNTGRIWFTATLLDNGLVLAASGYGPSPPGVKNTSELFDPPPPPPPPASPGGLMLLLGD